MSKQVTYSNMRQYASDQISAFRCDDLSETDYDTDVEKLTQGLMESCRYHGIRDIDDITEGQFEYVLRNYMA